MLVFQYVMEDIFFSGTPLLESVGEREPHVDELRVALRAAIRRAVVPLQAYAREYERWLHLINLDINAYVA